MTNKERLVVITVLSLVALMVGADLLVDTQEGVTLLHVFFEGSAGLAALFGIFYFARGSFQLQHQLADSLNANQKLAQEVADWKNATQKYVQGLSESIDTQLTKWNLSHAEKEVALLLLKGLSLKEIASIRNTSEKTARVQSMAVYAKSGLTGRSELAAFFLEDILQPQAPITKDLSTP